MKVEFKNSFAKDLQRIKGEKIKEQVGKVIEQVEGADDLQSLRNLKKLHGVDNYYRIKLGDYRIGLIVEKDVIVFVRLLHRKDIYRYFP